MNIEALFGLKGKIAIVTGAGSGIGRAIALQLAEAGAIVAIGDINPAGAAETAAEIAKLGGHALNLPLNQGDEESIETFVAAVAKEHGRIDILVNNAAYQHRALFDDTEAALWDKLYAINLRGPFLLMRTVARIMRQSGVRGRIVNISSLGSLLTIDLGLTAYSSIKAGVNGLTRNAALELGPDGITVNAILPGGTPTAGALNSPGPGPTEKLLARFPAPLGRMGEPEDIAKTALFFVSEAAAFITGQMLVVDGGFSIV